jgi:hypothetical protein
MNTFAVLAAKLPSMEGTFETVSLDYTAGCQVSAHMRTIGVDDVSLTILGAEYSEILACDNVNKELHSEE